MSKIFVSYRRSDSQGWAGRLGDDLVRAFGDVARFFDIESIEPGDDFVEAIERALADCEVVIALIGPTWLSATLPDGKRRLDDPGDFVRLEIETALARKVRVIPVLFGGAVMPQAASLPQSISALARRQGFELSDARWAFDCGRLEEVIERKTSLRRVDAGPSGAADVIRVGEGLVIEEGARVGDIAGVKGDLASRNVREGSIEVGRNATVRNSIVGDIVGVKGTSPSKEAE